MSTSARGVKEVLDEELHEIRKRRYRSGMWSKEQDEEITDEQLKSELTGMALSGGGVRSAALNLGLIQSFYSAGRMKLVDYLSTVSGGGYAGALLSTESATDRDGVNWGPKDGRNRLSIESESKHGQPSRIYEIALHGRRMGDLLKMLSRHLFGWVLTLAFLLSGLTAIAAVLAWMMRLSSSANSMVFLQELGFTGDIPRAYFPMFLAAIFWGFALILTVVSRALGWQMPPTTRFSYLVLLGTFVLGTVTILGMGQVAMTDLVTIGSMPKAWETALNNVFNVTSTILGALFAVVIAPYLMPTKLLESGAKKNNLLQKAVFNVAGYGVLIGTPVMFFYVLSAENLSGTHDKRAEDGLLVRNNLRNFREFAGMLKTRYGEAAAADGDRTEQAIWKAIQSIESETENGGSIEEWIRKEDARIKEYMQLGFVERWIDFGTSRLLQHGDGEFHKRLRKRARLNLLQTQFANAITARCLSDPGLFGFTLNHGRRGIVSGSVEVGLPGSDPVGKMDFSMRRGGQINGPNTLLIDGEPFESELTSRWLVADENRWEELMLAAYALEGAKVQGEWLLRDLTSPVPFRYSSPKQTSTEAEENSWWRAALAAAQAFSSKSVNNTSDAQPGASDSIADAAELPNESDAAVSPALVRFRKAVPGLSGGTRGEELAWLQTKLGDEIKRVTEKLGADVDPELTERYVSWLTTKKHELDRLLTTTRRANWTLLCARYPKFFSGPDVIYATHVNSFDQSSRLTIAGYAFLTFVILGLVTNLNTSCLHGVYRDELAAIWLRDPAVRIKDLDSCASGGPFHLINCTLNHLSTLDDPDPEQRSRFVFSYRFCGSKLTGYRETELYQNGDTTVADAMAISGAAVTTSSASNLMYKLVLLLTNFRLGQWVRNPAHYKQEHYWPSPLRSIISLLWNPQERPFCFLSDGGHLDNTGLASLLERRCRLMILGDASYDPDFQFEDLRRVLQCARGKYHVEFERLDPLVASKDRINSEWHILDELRPDENGVSPRHFVALRVKYPEPNVPDGMLIIAKSTMTGDEPMDLVELKRSRDAFPHDPTSNQFLPPEQFESYVILGRHIGNQILDFFEDLPPLPGDSSDAEPASGVPTDLVPDGWRGPSAQAAVAAAEETQTIDNEKDGDSHQSVDDATPHDDTETGDAVPDEAEDVEAAEAPEVPASSDVFTARVLLADDPPFTAETVDIACGLISAWLTSPFDTDDTSVLEEVSQWARTNSANAEKPLRDRISRRLIEAVQTHSDRIAASNIAQLEFLRMLHCLGERKLAGFSDAVQTLSTMSSVNA
ncbi:hypothetical protein [Fuerstiella marisgermanici]|uniref:Patatin-like phospholipase n=1 Tax=Fuerstiella marisgermanici TaxID=1891926 RepID=A0A1P8WL00_9PLAN|nr:hypothetical protein [Fuerstiella marisgermanici]APZ94740.1 hypothetical protein Fuma_04379 [Fuerstiella marisgermanici]